MSLINRLLRLLGRTDYDIFISYKRGDADHYGSALADLLTRKGFRCYLDQFVRELGQKDLPKSVREAVRNSSMLVILGTERASESVWIPQEIAEYKKRQAQCIIPIDFGTAKEQDWFKEVTSFHTPQEEAAALEKGVPSRYI